MLANIPWTYIDNETQSVSTLENLVARIRRDVTGEEASAPEAEETGGSDVSDEHDAEAVYRWQKKYHRNTGMTVTLLQLTHTV